MQKPKILVILGPTASGKSSLAITLARKLNGEIISADSRQVYKGLDIGTGKVTKKEMCGIPHHLLDVANPKKQFSVSEFKILAEKAIDGILAKGRLPILCGGTGFYIQTIVDNLVLPDVPPNITLRAKLEKKSTEALFAILKKIDAKRSLTIDPHNPRRLVRAIEIATALGKVPRMQAKPKYETIQIGIKIADNKLKQNIEKRLTSRMKAGMIAEAKRLHAKGLSWKRMEALGLEYRYLALYLQGRLTKREMIEKLKKEIWYYAKRQMTWFKRDSRIKWLTLKEAGKIRI